MTTSIFALNPAGKTLKPLSQKSMSQLGLSEPYDLETWLASSSDGLFGRQVLWISRQDRPSEEQRSDLVGVDKEGDLLIAELKKGEVGEDAITQALAYAAEYADHDASALETLFAKQSERLGATGLVTKANSLEDAHTRLGAHVGEDVEVNESQVLLVVGESFAPKALAICEYLNRGSGESSFSFECWRYAIYESGPGLYHFLLEQVLPAPSVREMVEARREAIKARKYLRDPIKVAFMRAVKEYLGATGRIFASSNRGQSYDCRIRRSAWPSGLEVSFSVWLEHPRLFLSTGLTLDTKVLPDYVVAGTESDGRNILQFANVDMRSATFTPSFGDELVKLVEEMKVKVSEAVPRDDLSMSADEPTS